MKKLLFVLLFLFGVSSLFAQLTTEAFFNRSVLDQNDSERPWAKGGIRSVHIGGDLDGDGKVEIIATDYSNGGRVHVLEYVDDETLELVWSSPVDLTRVNASTPRWVQTGDLDGDGNMEIIFPLGPRFTGGIQVYEYQGTDNDYGTSTIIDFPADIHTGNGHGAYRMDRERGTVADFDGDGQSELILTNADNNVYILSIFGDAPGFAQWEVEGGTVANNTGSLYGTIAQWHSVPADIDGDGSLEIVNHNWNFFGFSSIDPTGPNTYTYPTEPNTGGGVAGPAYMEFLRGEDIDGVGFMGVAVADVDGDGKDEIASVVYPDYSLSILSQPTGANGVYIWDDPAKLSRIKMRWDLSVTGDSIAQFWGCYAADLNNNGRDEILVGGFYGENVVAVEYNGTGDILDGNNYDVKYYFGGENKADTDWEEIIISDSVGIIDTFYSLNAWVSPGVMKMTSGDLIGNDSVDELVVCYQSGSYSGSPVYDSTNVVRRTWNGTSWDETEAKVFNERNIQIRVLQYSGGTGVIRTLNIATPNDYVLEQNYPNPFNPTTSIRFSLPISKAISIVVYDMLGNEVKTLIDNEEFSKGSYEVTWDGTNSANQKVASGNYIYTMKYGNFSKSVKMTFLK
ncbi:MAG: VCBS repeat-containing protein [Bacteroidetes bacterium]|nr:VCBS repeat-containing protein [Bacteroidota bacterium]